MTSRRLFSQPPNCCDTTMSVFAARFYSLGHLSFLRPGAEAN
jgi:hypothetical protein